MLIFISCPGCSGLCRGCRRHMELLINDIVFEGHNSTTQTLTLNINHVLSSVCFLYWTDAKEGNEMDLNQSETDSSSQWSVDDVSFRCVTLTSLPPSLHISVEGHSKWWKVRQILQKICIRVLVFAVWASSMNNEAAVQRSWSHSPNACAGGDIKRLWRDETTKKKTVLPLLAGEERSVLRRNAFLWQPLKEEVYKLDM